MLIFPAFQDRMVVLAAALVMSGGLAFIVNRMRVRTEEKKPDQGEENT
jgi:hypothetical protein